MQEKFDTFRKQYPEFIYRDYHIDVVDGEYVRLTYDFEIPGLCEFHPSNKIRTTNLKIVNAPDSLHAKRIAFSLGMVELISYWKTACPPTVKVLCGHLSKAQCDWWKKLYFGGLGEFLYTNGIETDFHDFMSIEAIPQSEGDDIGKEAFNNAGLKIIPVGGGKDSNVSMELTKEFSDKVFCFTVNDQPAREESAACAGYCDEKMIRTYRTLDKNMLELNKQGYLNGHTPFSAIVAFLSSYCAYLIGAEQIILSNESSANESNIEGLSVNHQYSKSYEFEKDFCDYFREHVGVPVHYFSLLRAFNELQIAKQFAAYKDYRKVFKSCNAGSKKNIWCCNCAKCLFVYIIISPFLTKSELCEIFGEDLLERDDLRDIFDGLVGFSYVKPFECVGTHKEINAALKATAEKYIALGVDMPKLLAYYYDKVPHENSDFSELLGEFNEENDIPEEFMPAVLKMYKFVSDNETENDFIDFIRDKSVLIMGFGREGKSTYNYIRKYLPSKELTVCDRTTLTDETLISDGHCTLVCGYDYMKVINDYDIVFKSPGISVRDIQIAPDTYVTCQLDMFMKYAPCTKIGITGTKGKTTTSTLTHCILKEAGFKTCLIGNIGVPVFELMDECDGMTAVIEMSSHQLEFTRTSPHIAVLTNIYEEHLDHYNGFEGYYNAKLNIVRGQNEDDFFIHNAEQDIADFISPQEIPSKQIVLGMPDENTEPFLKSLVNINPHLPGRHNALDTFFAATAAKLVGVSEDDIKAGLKTFEGIPHRLEYVGEFKGITFYNDCIATVPTAVMLGVEALERVNTLIIGGMDRGLDYTEFINELADSDIENIICLPETGHAIGKALLSRCEKKIIKVDDMEGAVLAAYENTAPGTICLISPAASSYNYYKNFEYKGEHYKELVRKFGE